MNRREFVYKSFLSAVCAAGLQNLSSCKAAVKDSSKSKKTNFLVILTDDLGWSDVSYNGSKFYETPNLDKFAAENLTFTNAYSPAPLCTASRASILTGKNPARTRITAASLKPYPKPDGRFPPKTKTSAPWQKMVEPTPYWYMLSEELTIAEVLRSQGYKTACIGKWHVGDEEYGPENQGFEHNFGANWQPGPPSYFYPYHIGTITSGVPGEYLTDRLSDEAKKFMEANKNEPFFLLLSHYAVHTPIQAKAEDVEYYKKKIDPNDCHNNPTYAGMIKSMDENVGEVLEYLKQSGLDENTVVIFISDNGGATYKDNNQVITCNKPLRGGKATLYEGGIRTPMIVRCPGKTKAEKCQTPVTGTDMFSTICELAGTETPKEAADSVSIVPLLKGKNIADRPLYFHFPHYIPVCDTTPCSSIRQGDYKLIKFYEGHSELYNLSDDIGETKNLAEKMPEKASQMQKQLEEWIESVEAQLPIANSAYDPKAEAPKQ